MSQTAPPASRSRRLALAVLCAAMLMVILDGSIVTVALPVIQRDLRFSPANLTWVVNAYLIAFGGLLLLAGRLGDLAGRKRTFIAGLALFTAASLLCGVSTGQQMLIAARFVQGIGGAAASAVSLGMIVTLFPEPRERGTAIGAFSFVGAAGASIGQVLGGILTQALGWHWIFFINLPIGAAAIVLAARALEPDHGPGLRAGADALGAFLVTAGLMLGVYTIVETGRYGWGSAHTIGYAAVAGILLAAFVARQAIAASPLLPLRIFRSRNVSGANLVQVLAISAMFGFQILIALYLEQVLGYGAAATGLAMLPAAVMIGAVSLGFSARLNARFGERRMLLTGLALLAAALGLLTRLPVAGSYAVYLLPTMLLVGGGGLVLPAMTGLGMSAASPRDAGVVSGLFNTTQQVGGALGVAVLSTLAAARTKGLIADGRSAASALTGGYHLAFGIGASLVIAAFVIAFTVLRQPRTKLQTSLVGELAGAIAAMMTTQPPRISVIVSTYNRSALLRRTLDTLTRQHLPAGEFEVIVADDGSSDDTAEVARSFSGRLRLRYVFQEDLGFRVAAARNAGARLASSPVLAFLDCGTLAGPDFVRSHLAAHAGHDRRAVLGYCFGYQPPLDEIPGLAGVIAELDPEAVVRRYRDDPQFLDIRRGAFERVGSDVDPLALPWIFFYGLNFSVSAGAFWQVGGFDESFRTWGGEDMELGYRLFHGGVPFAASHEAWTLEVPHERRQKANRQNNKRNLLRMLQKYCEPIMEIVCAAELRDTVPPLESDNIALLSWTKDAAGLDVSAEIEKATQDIPPGASVAIFGCGAATPPSLAPGILVDFDGRLLSQALADGRHTGYQLIGIRTPLRTGSVDTVIITSRLSGLWDRWGEQVLAEAHRIGHQVRTP